MQTGPLNDLYDTVLRYAALPVIALLLWLSWLIASRLMSPDWQRARRSRQIRKAVAERQARLAESTPPEENPTSSGSEKPDR